MKPRSKSLFHFTSKYEYLVDILANGFWPRYCLEDIEWLGFAGDKEIAFPMVCFCDIPLGRIQYHRKIYGSYGIGISRDWGVKNDVSPVRYVNRNSAVAKLYKSISDSAHQLKNPVERDEFIKIQQQLTPWSKPSSGVMKRGSDEFILDFYQESEWRHVPIPSYIRDTTFVHPERVKAYNDSMRDNHLLRFSFSDVNYIFVQSSIEISNLYDKLYEISRGNADLEFKRIVSRIISLDEYLADF